MASTEATAAIQKPPAFHPAIIDGDHVNNERRGHQMHMFKIVAADGATLTVCAEDYDAAADVFVVWHLGTYGTHPGEFEVLKRNRRWQGLNRAHLDEVLAKCVTGVATYDPAQGWTVTPLTMPEH